jgi:hypothetical protein
MSSIDSVEWDVGEDDVVDGQAELVGALEEGSATRVDRGRTGHAHRARRVR